MPLVARLEGATKRYGDVRALDGVDLSVRQGEILGLLGPNGAGKTTAVRLMMGLIRPDAGAASLFGQSPRAPEIRARTGVMLQLSGVPYTLTVHEVLTNFRRYYRRPMGSRELMALAEIEDIADRRLGSLSGGQRQRALFALAICGNPDLVFLDEPTVGLDVEARRRFWALIRRLASEGRSIVLTTHYLEEADALADRIVVLNRGRVIADDTPQGIKGIVPARRIRCRTSTPLEAIRALPGVSDATEERGRVEISTADAERVVRELLAMDGGLNGLEVTGARLEDAFVALTGDHRRAA